MVTQIYTAPLKASYNSALAGLPSKAVKPKPPLDDASNTSTSGDSSSSDSLASLREQSQKGVISIQSVISDFQNTMDALGVPDSVRQQVSPYLQVVAHQAQQDQPVTGLMKQNLKISADALDGFISTALGQKSTVVKEWVDALLLQPIAFHSDTPVTVSTVSSPASNGTLILPGAGTSSLPQAQSASETGVAAPSLKDTLQDAHTAFKNNDFEQAKTLYQSILSTMPANTSATVQGRLFYQLGRTEEKTGQADSAQSYYDKASDAFATGNQPDWQAKALNQSGLLSLKQGQLDDAQSKFDLAQQKAQSASDSSILPDALSNLGAVYRKQGKPAQAFAAYKQSLQASQAQQDTQGMQQTMQNMASLYLETGKPQKALKLLQAAMNS